MYKKFTILITALFLLLANVITVSADTRTENIELFLVVDKSKSMVEEIDDVTSYINEYFISDFLIPGDRLVFIQFYGNADLVFDGIVKENNIYSIMNTIKAIPADGRFTDIGNALDRLDSAVNDTQQRFDRKYLILLTDGKQEAPPESPYYTPDGSFNHKFLENTKTIQREGWKIMILGIGTDTAVEELAEELATTHKTLDFTGELPPPISQSEIIGRVTADNFEITRGVLSLSLSSEGYVSERTVIIEQITFQNSSGNYHLLDNKYSTTISPESSIDIHITLSSEVLNGIIPENTDGTVIFKFEGDTPFLPAVFSCNLGSEKNSEISSKTENVIKNEKNESKDVIGGFNWLIIIIVILVIAGIIAFILIRNLILHKDDDERKKNNTNEISSDS